MIKPLVLGSKLFATNLIQGPLAGISCAPFRRLLWKYGGLAFACTEMVSCKTLLHQPVLSQRRYVHKDPEEGPLCFQLSGNNPKEVAEAAKIATDLGADLIDLNCGCPVKKIRSKGAGSRLLTNTPMLYQLITALKANTTVPISIKIRVESKDERFNQEIAQVVQDAGVNYLIVHGRHWTEHYDVPCRYTDIQFFVEALSIPVIGNGDIACVESLRKMLATGCAGVMISRACVGQPWLMQKLAAEIENKPFLLPTLQERGLMFVEHVEQLAKLLNSDFFAILQARKFAKYYARHLPFQKDFAEKISYCESLQDLVQYTWKYFE